MENMCVLYKCTRQPAKTSGSVSFWGDCYSRPDKTSSKNDYDPPCIRRDHIGQRHIIFVQATQSHRASLGQLKAGAQNGDYTTCCYARSPPLLKCIHYGHRAAVVPDSCRMDWAVCQLLFKLCDIMPVGVLNHYPAILL